MSAKTKSKSKSKQKSKKDAEQPSGIFDKTNNIFLDKSHFILKDTCEETKIKSNKSFAILFVYVDWCPYCISAKDIIIDLRNELKKFNLNLYLANQTKDKYLSFVNSYPTIYFVDSDGFLEIMNTDRTVLSLFNLFINKIVNRMNPNAQIANKVEDILQQQQHMSIPNSLYNNSHAIQLTDNDLLYEDDQIKIKPEIFINPGLLKAYASWCIHCQVGSKKIKYLADKLNVDDQKTTIYVIEMSNNQNSNLNRLVQGFPTYLYIDDNKQINQIDEDIETHNPNIKQIMDFIMK